MTLGLLPLHRGRPMALLEREPTSTMSEAVLVRGYARVGEISRPCLCGGRIRTLGDDDAIAHAVRAHNDSPGHTAWAIAAGWR